MHQYCLQKIEIIRKCLSRQKYYQSFLFNKRFYFNFLILVSTKPHTSPTTPYSTTKSEQPKFCVQNGKKYDVRIECP